MRRIGHMNKEVIVSYIRDNANLIAQRFTLEIDLITSRVHLVSLRLYLLVNS